MHMCMSSVFVIICELLSVLSKLCPCGVDFNSHRSCRLSHLCFRIIQSVKIRNLCIIATVSHLKLVPQDGSRAFTVAGTGGWPSRLRSA